MVRTTILVREVMNSPVISAPPDTSIKEIAAEMVKSNVGSVVITERDKPIGIVTDGDIVAKVVAQGMDPVRTLARSVMTQPLHVIEAEKDVTEAAREMRKLHVKRLGVVYKDKLAGILSISDLVSVTPELVALVSEKARIVTGELRKQRGYVAGYCDSCNEWSDYLLESDGKFLCEDCRVEVVK